jgi:hypothetical protein
MTMAAGAKWVAAAAFLALSPLAAASAQDAQDAALDTLEKRITRLEDMNAVERLQATYGYLVDKSQWEPLAELFAKDGTLEIGGRGVYTGRERVLSWPTCRPASARMVTAPAS